MPSAKKVTFAELRIGIMALAAMIILAVLIFLLTGTGDVFASNAHIYMYLDDSAAMATGSDVRLNGLLIGSIDTITFSGLKDKGRAVRVDMKIKKSLLAEIPEDSVAGVTAANLLGQKFINITKGQSPRPVKNGGTLKSLEGQDIPELMTRAGDILGAFQVMLKRVDVLLGDIEAGKGNIGLFLRDEELYNRLTSTTAELQKVIAAVNSGKGTLGHLLYDDNLYQELRSPIKRIDDLLAGLQQGQGTAGRLLKDPALYDDFRQTVADIRTVLKDLNDGKGTAGKFLKDEELYRRINQLIAKLDATTDKINSGQGTVGQLLVNPQLYESLNGATREMQGLMKDIHANPKKFLRIKLGLF